MTQGLQGWDQLERKLKKMDSAAQKAGRPMQTALALIQDDLSEQKPKAKGAFTRLATPGQRRAYWARVSSGEIDHVPNVGYKRTGSTRAWTPDIQTIANGIRGVLGNAKSHMIYVQGSRQQPFHKETGWQTVDGTIEKNRDKVGQIFRNYVHRIING